MKKTALRFLSLMMALILCLSVSNLSAFAAETINGNTWYGDEVAVDITEGTDGYNYMVLFRKPVHGYEFAGHFIGEGEGAQTFVVIDTAQHNGTTWAPNGLYELGTSNYDVLYCCDVETMVADSTYYKRVNLEDSEYYNVDQAKKIRAIVTNSYPYVSLEDMKAALAEAGFEYAEELKRGEIISAVQAAIWASANNMTAEDFRYAKSYKVSDNLQWGYPMHDTSNDSGLDVSGKRVFATYEEVGIRHDALVDYLLALPGVEADHNQIVITNIEVADSLVYNDNGIYDIRVNVELNRGADADDDVVITAYVGDEAVETIKVTQESNYALSFQASVMDKIKVVVSGTQNMEKGVYFYAPKPADVNGDGEATSREVSQNLVGVSMGQTPVYAEAEVEPEFPEEPPVNFNLSIHKIDENGESLTGAAFNLYYSVDGVNYLVGAYEVDELGMIQVEDLLPGEYVLTETKTPFAHISLSGDIRFTILEDGTLEGLQLPEGVSVNSQEGVIDVTVINKRVSTSAQLDGIKYLDGEVAGGFEFALSFNGNIIETVFSNEDGTFSFSPLFFNEAGTYTFEVFEVFVDTDEDLMIYDETVYTVTITVTLSEDGQVMTAVVEGAENIEFYNETETIIPDEPVPENPPTGDGIHTAFFAAIASLMLLGTCIVLKRKEC